MPRNFNYPPAFPGMQPRSISELDLQIQQKNYTQMQQNAERLSQSQHARYEHWNAQNTRRLEALHKLSQQNAALFSGTPMASMQEYEQKLLAPIVAGLTASPPDAPTQGDTIAQPDREAERYLWVYNESRRKNPDDLRLFGINVNVDQIRKDQQVIRQIIQSYQSSPAYTGLQREPAATARNAEIFRFLQELDRRLELLAQQDVTRNLAHQYAQNHNYMNGALGHMGKLIAVLFLAAYALAEGISAFANKRVPLVALAALAAAGFIADERLRKAVLSSKEQIQLDEVTRVTNGGTFKELAQRYGFYGYNGAWEPVLRTLMQDRKDVNDFLKKLSTLQSGSVAKNEAQDFVNGLTGDGKIQALLLTMIARRDPRAGKTDFERLISVLHVTDKDVQEAIAGVLSVRATGRI